MSEEKPKVHFSEFIQIAFIQIEFSQDPEGLDTQGSVVKPHMANLHGPETLTGQDWEKIFNATTGFVRDFIQKISAPKSPDNLSDKVSDSGEVKP